MTFLCNRITLISSYPLLEYGYMGMVEERTMYALAVAPAGINYQDPGAVRARTAGTVTTVEQKVAEAIYIAHKGIFDSQMNVKRAIIDALNLAVPRSYKRENSVDQIQAKIYKYNDDSQHT